MIKKTLHFLWGKKFGILIFALAIILLPNTIGRDLQVRTTTVITEMMIERDGENIKVTAQKFKAPTDEKSETQASITFKGTDIRTMLADVSLGHCKKIEFKAEPDLEILHELYHFQDLRGNTKVNDGATIGELLKNHYCHYRQSVG